MDSFLGLFDPTEGQGKTKPSEDAKKKDGPKGRRRGRRARSKGGRLPEECSFLCEPALGSQLLVTEGSYIDDHYEERDAPTADVDKRPKRRGSGRKYRRSKRTPSVEPQRCADDAGPLNNAVSSLTGLRKEDSIGKNVNNLFESPEEEFDQLQRSKRKEERAEQRPIYSVLDSLGVGEGLRLDFTARDLEDDDLCSDGDDSDDSYDDSDDDSGDDSGPEVRGSLPPEPRFGNVEYKLRLGGGARRKFQHLLTQMKWRLVSGGGVCVYVLGASDGGALRGLGARALRGSLRVLRRLAGALGARAARVLLRPVRAHRAVAEVHVRKVDDSPQSVELRVAVMGANEAGKSTLIGVLTQGELDNGRGSARLNVFRHVHEVKSGRTSSLSHEILGFDAQGAVVNYGCASLLPAERAPACARLVQFMDVCGHRKYQRTTVRGVSGYSPHYAMVVVSSTGGATAMSCEHAALALALRLPLFLVLSKWAGPAGAAGAAAAAWAALGPLLPVLEAANKKVVLIANEEEARACVAPSPAGDRPDDDDDAAPATVPVFPVSCVKGTGLRALQAYLLALRPHDSARAAEESCEFQIDEIFHVAGASGPVCGGLLAAGVVREGDRLLIGPLETGEFVETTVKTVHRNRVPCAAVRAGQSASLGLHAYPPNIRQGMVLLAIPDGYRLRRPRPAFGACPRGKCPLAAAGVARDHDKGRRVKNKRNRSLLQELQQDLVKPDDFGANIFAGEQAARKRLDSDRGEADSDRAEADSDRAAADSDRTADSDAAECRCGNKVYLEDPSDPRGCMYFQATLQLLHHSASHVYRGFQCTAHIGNVRQTAIIEGILSEAGVLRAGARASVLMRFARAPEYVRAGRRVLCRAGGGTGAVGVVTQVFPHLHEAHHPPEAD